MGAVAEGGIVVDPFAGSGTTGIAAMLTGRRALLAEQSEHYRAMATERMGAARGTPAAGGLFGEQR
jgi:site-specific DNA-methyltransferase (adenine-specific)